jgi:hypothetical protein
MVENFKDMTLDAATEAKLNVVYQNTKQAVGRIILSFQQLYDEATYRHSEYFDEAARKIKVTINKLPDHEAYGVLKGDLTYIYQQTVRLYGIYYELSTLIYEINNSINFMMKEAKYDEEVMSLIQKMKITLSAVSGARGIHQIKDEFYELFSEIHEAQTTVTDKYYRTKLNEDLEYIRKGTYKAAYMINDIQTTTGAVWLRLAGMRGFFSFMKQRNNLVKQEQKIS